MPLTDIPDMKGTVVNAATNQPIAGATVEARGRGGQEASAATDGQGNFAIPKAEHWEVLLPLPPGPAGGGPSAPYVKVTVRAAGYQSVQLDNWYRDGTEGTIKLIPLPSSGK